MDNFEIKFREFYRFLKENEYQNIALIRNKCNLWEKKCDNESISNQYLRIGREVNYSRFLNGLGYDSYIPKLPKKISTFKPHIFSSKEIEAFFNASDSLIFNPYSTIQYTYSSLFRFFYGCGIRLGEALSLKMEDVNMLEQYLIIRDSKNGEERIVPFSKSVLNGFVQYSDARDKIVLKSNYVFIKMNGKPLTRRHVYTKFRQILFEANIPHGGKSNDPRIHDFLLSFAVRSLASMVESKLDLYYSIPILSKYLGHKSIRATEKYIMLTDEMFKGMLSEVNKICAFIFPVLTKT
jgi:integrase